MIFSTRSCLFFFFLLTLLLFSTLISARDSYSFDKFQRENPKDQNPNNRIYVQTNETTEQDDQNPTFIPESGNGYGLYGRETAYNNNEEFNNRKYDETVNYNDNSFSTPSLSQTQEPYNNYRENYPKPMESYDDDNKDTSYYENSNGYGREKREKEAYNGYDNNKDTSYYENSNGYGRQKREKEAYNGYNNNMGRQGMSDTRFMANGNYYYDLDDERNHGRYYQKQLYYNYKPTGYNEKSSFENPYNSNNMMNQQSDLFGEDQGNQFTP